MSLTNNLINAPTITGGFKRKYTVSLADIKAGGAFLTVDIVLDTFPAGAVLLAERIQHTAAISGTAGPIGTATARLKLVTTAATPITTQLGSAALNVFAAPGVLDGTSSIIGITPVAGDADLPTQLVMTVTQTGATTGLSDALTGSIDAVAEVLYLGV